MLAALSSLGTGLSLCSPVLQLLLSLRLFSLGLSHPSQGGVRGTSLLGRLGLKVVKRFSVRKKIHRLFLSSPL